MSQKHNTSGRALVRVMDAATPGSYIGTGEKLQDVAPFDGEVFVGAIFS